jgi:predicted negative regulator of RcsB-dependent stress response
LSDHISRKELKQDKIHDAFEHGAEAVFSHKQGALIVLLVIAAVAVGYFGWKLYDKRQTDAASAALDTAMKAYNGRVAGTPEAGMPDPTEPTYPDQAARSNDAAQKFTAVADKYPSTNPGRLARYYAALCLENLERHNQALEDLNKLTSSGDKEIAAMAQYQIAIIDARTGKTADAVKMLRALADKPTAFVPRPLVLLELADTLRQTNQQEAATVYQQIKKEFPASAISEQADRGLETLSPKS